MHGQGGIDWATLIGPLLDCGHTYKWHMHKGANRITRAWIIGIKQCFVFFITGRYNVMTALSVRELPIN